MASTTTTLDDDTDDAPSPGWDAISARLGQLYPGQEPRHFGTLISHMLGGPDPLDGISAWRRMDPVPHWHFVTYGLSELYAKESDDPEVSGYGFELTFRLAMEPGEVADANAEPPAWALNFLQNLARYVFQSGNVWEPVYGLSGVALGRNRDEWMLRLRRMGSCPCKQPGRPIARFRPNPSGKCLAGRSAALRRLLIAGLSTAHRALHPIPARHLRDPG